MDVDSDRNPKRKGSPIDEGGRYRSHPTDRINRSHALAQVFEKKVLELMNRLKKRGLMSLALEDWFKAHFGASPEICADIWLQLDLSSLPEKQKKVEFLLWALFLIRQYPKETVGATFAGGVHEQTWRDHAWHFVDRISQLEVDVVGVFGRRERTWLLPVPHPSSDRLREATDRR
jgi:hypothetical protein